MKLIYLANQRLPTEKAYGIQIAKMCEAFADAGLEVDLVIPTRTNLIKKDIFDYYNVKRNFKVIQFYSPDFYLPGIFDKVAFFIKQTISALILSRLALQNKYDIIYSRDELPIFLLSFFRKNLIFEIHKFSDKRSIFYKRSKGLGLKIIAISKGLKDKLIGLGFSEKNILVAHDGIDPEEFNLNFSEQEARGKTNLPLDKKIVMYTGHLFDWKGADVLVGAAQMLPPDILTVIVGGLKNDIIKLKAGDISGVVRFEGLQPHTRIPVYLKAADILILPNKKDRQISEFYTSPLKLFEYMASGKPIIASNLSSIREILNESNSFLFEPNNPNALAQTINTVLENKAEAETRSHQALEDVEKYTWRKRVDKILNFI